MHVVTTPTGNIGSKVVRKLLDANEAVRVIVRDASKLPKEFQGKIDVFEGSSDNENVLMKALKGAESFFLLIPPLYTVKDSLQHTMQFTKPACNAIVKQGVKRVVSVSGICHSLEVKAGPVTSSYVKDLEIEKLGVAHRALWCPGFMENLLMQIEPIKHTGMFFGSSKSDVKVPLVATRDIAESGAKLLMDKAWTGQGGLAVLGPEDLTWNEVATILSDVFGKTVRYQQISSDEHKAQMISHGVSPEYAQELIDMLIAKDNGLDAEPRNRQNTTETSLRQFATELMLPAMSNL